MTTEPEPSTSSTTVSMMGQPSPPDASTAPAATNPAGTTSGSQAGPESNPAPSNLSAPAWPPPYPTPGSYRTTAAGPYGPATRWQALPPATDYRMRRSGTDKMLAGVCGGIAEHTDIDPVYIRLAFLVSAFWGGIGVIAYLAAAIIMPRPLP